MKNIRFSFIVVIALLAVSACSTGGQKDALHDQGPIRRTILASEGGSGIDYVVDQDAIGIMENMEVIIKKGLGEEGNATEIEIAKVYRDADKIGGTPDFHITKAKAHQQARVFKMRFLDALGSVQYKSFAKGNPPAPATSIPASSSQ